MSNIVANAEKIARQAHKEQRRKWGEQEPYIVHPEWCANKAREIGASEVEQAAMWLHDVLEDIAIPTNTVEFWEQCIRDGCGDEVLARCWELTNISDTPEWMEKHPNPKRSEKWAVNLAHIRTISDAAKRDKMIDRLANVLTMGHAPHRMKQKYVPESRELLAACRYVDEALGAELEEAINKLEKAIHA
jgi:(p)ppGpp synthase/HD superfamily hydrolase